MTKQYPNAPIAEAIIDLQVRFAGEMSLDRLRKVGEKARPEYPHQEEIAETVGELASGPSRGPAPVHRILVGWKFCSEDHRQIAQARHNGLTFSRLAPYERWERFRDEARRLWNAYRETLHPLAVERVAVRYINRIDIPGERIDLKDYFRTSPEIAPELPQQLEGYFMQLRLPFPEIAGHCLVNQTIVQPAKEGVVSVILDIDLFRANDLPQNEEGVWSYFEALHETKNRIFEACITDTTRSLFSTCQS